ncbi:MAG: AAA family ATPase [Methanomicrobiales archaeon]
MLWIEKYRPAVFEEIIGHERVVEHLRSFTSRGSLPHLLISGPHGTGKSAAVECVARKLYGENWVGNCTMMHASDLFLLGKKYLEDDERYAHIYRKDESLINNFKHIIRWYASLRPLDAPFKMVVIDDASALTRDAQSSLRRTMERYSQTCRFVFCTTHPAAIIPAIASRCLPFFFGPVAPDLAQAHLRGILAKERPGGCCTDDEIDLIVQASGGDLRKSIMLLQIAAESGEPFDLAKFRESETSMVASAIYLAIASGDGASANRRIESLIIEYGLTAGEVLGELRKVMKREYNDPRIACALADTDYLIGHCNNEYIQLNAFAARIMNEVFR